MTLDFLFLNCDLELLNRPLVLVLESVSADLLGER